MTAVPGDVSKLSLTSAGLAANAALGVVNALAVEVAQGDTATGKTDAVHPDGSAGAVEPSKFCGQNCAFAALLKMSIAINRTTLLVLLKPNFLLAGSEVDWRDVINDFVTEIPGHIALIGFISVPDGYL